MKPMRRSFRRTNRDQMLLPIGWLFADLLLMLAMLFLVANTGYIPALQISKPTPIVKPIPPTPTPTLVSLDLNPIEFNLTNIDYKTLLSSHPQSAIAAIQNQVKVQKQLWGRRAALVLAFGVATNVTQIGTANQISGAVYNALRELGRTQEIVVRPGITVSFWQTRYYSSPLHDIEPSLGLSTVEMVIYCFNKTSA